MEIDRYLGQIVNPTIADFEANPTSVRHAFLAAVAVYHLVDYLGLKKGHLAKLRRDCADFAAVDRIAHAFKHVEAGHRADPGRQPLSSGDVVARPPAVWDEAVWDMTIWNDTAGGVTVNGERAVDVLSAINGAVRFLLQKGAHPASR